MESTGKTTAMESTTMESAAAEASGMKAAAAHAAAVETAATAETATAMATTSAAATSARQRHGWRNQADGCNGQQRDHCLTQHECSPSEISLPTRTCTPDGDRS
jgi:hypothetical protein